MTIEKKYSEGRYWVLYIGTLVAILVSLLMVCFYTFHSFSTRTLQDAFRFGENSAQKSAYALNAFLLKEKDVLNVSYLFAEKAIAAGMDDDSIREQVVWVSKKIEGVSEDANYSGIYGFVRGEYVDGIGWVPPEKYNPTERPWYKAAIRNCEKTALSSPYGDLYTSKKTVSISRCLSDQKSVVSMDIDMDVLLARINVENDEVDGFWMIIDGDSVVVAHSAHGEFEKKKLVSRILDSNGGWIEVSLNGKEYVAFPEIVMNGWHVVKLFNKSALQEKNRWILIRSIMLSLLGFILVGLFCTVSFCGRIRALRVNSTKSAFFANMGYEIRTPINGILGLNSIILKEISDPVLKEYAQNVQTTGQSLLSLVNDVLDILKIESGKMVLESAEYNLFNVLSDCFNIIAPRASAKNLRFSIDCDPNIPTGLLGDEERIRQVICSLLSNAVKNTEYGDISLSVKFSPLSNRDLLKVDNSIVLKIVVRDTGIGIRPTDMNHVFDSFRWVDKKQNVDVQGTGLILSLTKRLVDMFGGEISVRSRYEEGSTFMVSIPQIVLNVEPMGDFSTKFWMVNSQKEMVEETLLAPNAHILVVDDVNLNLNVIRGLLKNSRAIVDTAINGAQCLELVKSKRYDIIFIDHLMPVMDGVETFERMKALGNTFINKDTPVIMLTTIATDCTGDSLDAGFTDYLSKPMKEADLNRMLKRYLPERLLLTPDDLVNYTGEYSRKEMAESWERRKTAMKDLQKKEKYQASPAMTPVSSAASASSATSAELKKGLEALRTFLDVELGMGYCGNDETFYTEMLGEFVNDCKLTSINEKFEKEDWKNYQILVHALKSTSLTIGAKELSESAKSLELACKTYDIIFVKKSHRRVMEMYEGLLNCIKSALEEK